MTNLVEAETKATQVQKRLWLSQQLSVNPAVYNVCESWLIQGKYDIEQFVLRLRSLIDKYQALRTTFFLKDDLLFQRIYSTGILDLKIHQHLPSEKEIENLVNTNFNLSQLPLVRCSIYQVNGDNYQIVLLMPHLICDGWSLNILLSQLFQLESDSVGESNEKAFDYYEYSLWCEKYYQSEKYYCKLDQYVTYLTSFKITKLELPYLSSAVSENNNNGNRIIFEMDSEQIAALSELSQKHRCSLSLLFQAALYVLIYRYTAQTTIPLGMPVANRSSVQHQKVVGLVLNTMLVICEVNNNLDFIELMKKTKATLLSQYKYQGCLYDDVMRELSKKNSAQRNESYQVFYNFLDYTSLNPVLEDIQIKNLEIRPQAAMADLSLDIRLNSSGARAYFEYKTDCFTEETIEQLLVHYKNLIDGLLKEPTTLINDLPMHSNQELDLLLA